MLLHLFEEDTLLFLLVGKLWLKAVYQVVIFVFLFLSKIGKISKIIKNPKIHLLSNREISHRNYWLSCVLSIKIFRGRVFYFSSF